MCVFVCECLCVCVYVCLCVLGEGGHKCQRGGGGGWVTPEGISQNGKFSVGKAFWLLFG